MNPDVSPQVNAYVAERMQQLDMVLERVPEHMLFPAFDPSPYADLTDRLKELYPNTVLIRARMVLSGEDLPLEERRYLENPRVRHVEAFWLIDPETLDEPARGFVELGMIHPPHNRGVLSFSVTRHYQGLKGGEVHLAQYPVDPHPDMPEFELCLTELILQADRYPDTGYPVGDPLDGTAAGRHWVDVLALPASNYAGSAKPTPGPSS